MACLSVSLLGSLTVTLDGQPISKFEYNQVRALLAYLITEAESPHRREALAGLLWPDQSQKAAFDSLRNALAKLRQAIGDHEADPPYLFIINDAIQFNRASDHKLDLERFTHLLTASKTHSHRRLESCRSCADRLQQAVELYQAEFLQGFSLPDSDLFEEWLRIKREKFLLQAMDATRQLASIYEWRGEYEQALTYARRATELDAYHEQAHKQVMRLLASLDMRAEACMHYEKFSKFLEAELGVQPAEETTHIYEQIKYGTFQPAPTPEKRRLNNLPPNLTSFVGRERELLEINALLEDPNCRLLTLVGPGGVGKTRLATMVAEQQLEAFPHGACFVALEAIISADYLAQTMLEALCVTPAQQGDLKELLIGYLKDKEIILVLDNFEHLLDGAGLIAEILQKAPGVLVLVTSRQRLGLQAEWLFEVNGLSYPSGKEIRDLAAYDALQLFTQRLHSLKTRTTVFEDDLPSVTRICRLVEGLPLGIELAASAVRLRSIEQVAIAIENGKEDLAASWKDVPERHRSLRAVFDHSFRLLTEQERVAFCGLAVFRGGFTAEAAEQVAGATRNVLDALVEHSMVRFNPEKDRYDLHELIWQYAIEKLASLGLELTFHQKQLNYYLNLAEHAETRFISKNSLDQYSRLVPEVENFREILSECINHARLGEGLRIAGALGTFWRVSGFWQEGKTWFDKILASRQSLPRDSALARGLMHDGWLTYIASGEIDIPVELSEQALALWKDLGDQQGIAFTLTNLARLVMVNGEWEKSRKYLEESLHIYQLLDDLVHQAYVKNLLGEIFFYQDYQDYSDYGKSFIKTNRELFETSLQINRNSGLDYMVAWVLLNIGHLEMCLSNFDQARSIYEESLLHLTDQTTAHSLLNTILSVLGLVNIYLGNFAHARSYLERGLAEAKIIGRKPGEFLCNLSYLSYRQGDLDQALYYLQKVFLQLESDDNVFHPTSGRLEPMLGLLQACEEQDRATRLFAFAKARREKNKISLPLFIRPEYERTLALTRAQLGESIFIQAWEEGRKMTLEQAKACALGAKVRISN